MPLWHQAEAILYDDQPYTFLHRSKSLLFIDKRIANLRINKLGLNLTQQPIEPYVPGMKQKYRN